MTAAIAESALAAVAAHGLAGTAHSLPSEPLDAAAWQELRAGATAKRLNGLLLSAIDSGDLPASEGQRAQAVEDQARAMSGALLLEDLLLRVTELFAVAGVASRALKGTAVAHLDYPSPDLRAYGDVDVLVRSDDFDRAAAALGEAGMQRVFQPPRPGWDKRYGKGAMFRCADGLEVDLHRTFCTPPVGLRIDLDDVWSGSDALWLAGQIVEALPREVRLLNAAYSGAVSDTISQAVDAARHRAARSASGPRHASRPRPCGAMEGPGSARLRRERGLADPARRRRHRTVQLGGALSAERRRAARAGSLPAAPRQRDRACAGNRAHAAHAELARELSVGSGAARRGVPSGQLARPGATADARPGRSSTRAPVSS